MIQNETLKELCILSKKLGLRIEFNCAPFDYDIVIRKYKEHPVTKKLYTVRNVIPMSDLDILVLNFEDAITELSKDMDKEFEKMFEKDDDLSKWIDKIERMDFE